MAKLIKKEAEELGHRLRDDLLELDVEAVGLPPGQGWTPGRRPTYTLGKDDIRLMRHSRRLAGQRALPNQKEQLFELGEAPRPKLGDPFALDVAEDVVDF